MSVDRRASFFFVFVIVVACVAGACTAAPPACRVGDDCASGVCLRGVCGEGEGEGEGDAACSDRCDCDPGRVCVSGVCAGPGGGVCSVDDECPRAAATDTCALEVCNVRSGRCFDPTLPEGDCGGACPPDRICSGNVCRGLQGAACDADEDCADTRCVGGVCG